MQGLGFLPDNNPDDFDYPTSGASGVSADGSIIVGSGTEIIDDGSGLGFPNFAVSFGGQPGKLLADSGAGAVSADGSTVVGYTWIGESGPGDTEAFHLKGGILTKLGRLVPDGQTYATAVSADGSVVAGVTGFATRNEAWRWTSQGGLEGLGILTPQANRSEVTDMTPDGAYIVGWSYTTGTGNARAVRWLPNLEIEPIFEGFGQDSYARAVSDDGAIVVGRWANDAVVWDETNGMQSIKQILADAGIDLAGWTLLEATAVSADGQKIAGWGTNPDGQREPWLVDLQEGQDCAAEYALKQFERALQSPWRLGSSSSATTFESIAVLHNLRCFRDNVLARSATGRRLTRLYYDHSPELRRILSAHPDLAASMASLLVESQMLLDQTEAVLVLDRRKYDLGRRLLTQIAALSSPELEGAINEVQWHLEQVTTEQVSSVSLDLRGEGAPHVTSQPVTRVVTPFTSLRD